MSSIEEELKTGFQSAIQKVHLNILYTSSILKNYFSKRLKSFDLSLEQYNVLRIVRGATDGQICVKQISERMIERNSNTTRILDKLENKKLVIRQKSKIDKRELGIKLTQEGQLLLSKIDLEFKVNPLHESTLKTQDLENLSLSIDTLRDPLLSF